QGELKKNPARLEYRLSIGNLAVRAAKYELAIQEFLAVLMRIDKYSPMAGDLYFRIGETYRLSSKPDLSVIFLRQAKELLPRNAMVLGTLALVLDRSGQKEEAAREYKSALDANLNSAEALNDLAFVVCENGGNLDAALRYAQRARELEPDSQAVADTLAWVYAKKNMTEPAISILREIVQKSPERSTYHYHLAVALEEKGDRSAAIEELRAAMKYNPRKNEELRIKELLLKIGKPDQHP
ncbi:MAG TPA: tetratricopeptide repeat protein, partial [Bryobacteraceae bacterium]|nr:tetratricopeptide repeat protein [Bryobacteraceae bacterium]